ncbi:MAG: FAD-binding oxidoreductase [Pseudoruegeria sp.]
MVDVTVMGAGIFGLSVAWSCLQKGATVRVIDPHGVAAGSSGGLVGALAPHTPERWEPKKDFQLESLLMAEAYWAEIENISSQSSGYGRTGRLQPILDEHGRNLAEERIDQARELWRGQAIWEIIPANQADGWAPQSPTGYLVHDTLSARIHPRQACTALAVAIRALGAEIVTEGSEEGSIVWATGLTGLETLAKEFEKPIGNGVKGQAMLLDHDARDRPQLFAGGIHVIPHADGTTGIGSTSERYYGSPRETDELLEGVYERALEAFPVLKNAKVMSRWAGVRPRSKSRAPMLGAWPARGGHYVANGGFKIGFGMAPRVGLVMADLVLEGRDDIPEGFRVIDNF